MRKLVLSVALCSMMSSVFADVDVVDESQNYSLNEPMNQDLLVGDEANSVFVLSDNENNEGQTDIKKQANGTESSTLQLLLSKVESMQLEIAELRGILEQQGHQLENATPMPVAKKQDKVKPSAPIISTELAPPVKDMTASIPTIRDKSGNRQASNKNHLEDSLSTEEVKASGDPMDEQLSYVAAYEYVKHKQYEKALPAMKSFISAYPEGPYVANAHYWLGELYGVRGEHEKALVEFQTVINEFSDSNKVSSAQYKLGITYEKIGKKELAQSEFIKVTEAFPGTAVARLAQAKLK